MRTYKRSTERADTPRDVMERACHAVIFEEKCVNATSKQYDIAYKTLHRYVAKLKEKSDHNPNLTRAELTPDSGFRVTGILPLNENIFPDSEFSGSYVTDRPVSSSHNIAGSSTTDEGTIAVPSTSITRPSNSSSTVDKVSISDTHIVSEGPMQNPTTIIDQATAATSSRTRSSSTKCESPSVIDDVSNFLYEAAPREHLKTPENVSPPETEILLNLTPLSNLNMSSTSFATSEEIRPFPKAVPRLENRRSVRERKSSIYTDTPEKENLMEMKQKRKETFKKTKSQS
ncbi:hypothetical protein HHI36_008653 [Cryptolaemus montrouzieri]|uniref:HTH psq-type domain-containing protein n=1 Tax=Cryptolaemus montrouzieri TaxID=559131 RepID=A0ABD2MT23_9CUCU